MDNPLHEIDKIFRNALEPTEEAPSGKVWDVINKKLDSEGRKKPGAAYFRLKSALLFLLFIAMGLSTYWFLNKKKLVEQSKNIPLVKNNNLQIKPNNATVTKEKSKEENKIATRNINEKAETDSGMKAGKTKWPNTITILNNANKKNIASSKKIPLHHSIDAHEVLNNKNTISVKQTKSYSFNKQNGIKRLDNGLTHNRFHLLKDVILNGSENDKPKVVKNGFDLNIVVGNDGHNILHANQANIEMNATTASQLLITANLPQLAIADLPLLRLTNNSIAAKAPVKKQAFMAKSHFYISAFAAPEWQGFQLQDNDDQQSNSLQNRGGDTKNKIKHREDEDASLVAGIGVGYRLSKKFFLETGLRYSEYLIRTDSLKLFAAANNSTGNIGYKINTSLGYGYLNNTNNTLAVGDSTTIQNLQQSVKYVTIPFLLRYQMGKGRLSFNPALGFMFNFILGSSIRTNLESGQRQMVNLQGLKKLSVGMLIAPSVYYRIGNHVSIGLEPYFNYTISPINKATVVDSYPYGVGLGTTLRYQF